MTAIERAEQVIRDVHKELPNVWLGGRQRYVLAEAIAKALADARREALSWTSEKPKEPGWYWWRLENGKPEMVVEVRDPNYLDDLREAEWAGPIEPPSQRAIEGV